MQLNERHAITNLRYLGLALACLLMLPLALVAAPAEAQGGELEDAASSKAIEVCSNGTVIADPRANPTLVADCAILFQVRDTLAGRARLNWSANTPFGEWDGIVLEGAPSRLTELALEASGLRGTIPPALGSLSSLVELWLDLNGLTGEIPPELGNLTTLENLRLDENRLTGEIPAELFSLPSLRLMELAGNRLTGEIPPEVGSAVNLELLFLDRNQLTGEIPPEIGRLKRLKNLWLGHNQLRGAIPVELTALPELGDLQLRGNLLTGEIPPEFATMPSLWRLLLDGNNFEGCLVRMPALVNTTLDRFHPGTDQFQLGIPHCAPQPAKIEVRVRQSVSDPRILHFSARTADGSWDTLDLFPLRMSGLSGSGLFRYGDIAVAAPLGQAGAEIRVWQRISDLSVLYVSARPAGGSWRAFGTVPLEMQQPSEPAGYRYGDIAVRIAVVATHLPVR